VVLDLDQTLVSTHEQHAAPPYLLFRSFPVNIHKANGRLTKGVLIPRPGIRAFLRRLATFAEVVIFTAAGPGEPQVHCFA
jgi:hypothetical protein